METRHYETKISKETTFSSLTTTGFRGTQTDENKLELSYFNTRQSKKFFVEFVGEKEFRIKSKPSGNSAFSYGFAIVIAIAAVFLFIIALSVPLELKSLIASIVGIVAAGLFFGIGILIDKAIWYKLEKHLIDKCYCKRITNKKTT